MPHYIYRCTQNHETEIRKSKYDPYPTPECMECGSKTKLQIQPSLLYFGPYWGSDNPFAGSDDDFSLRYKVNGIKEAAKRNRTQGTTNVRGVLRKWGKKGQPLETRTDINPKAITSRPLPRFTNLTGGQFEGGHVPAPESLSRSDGR
jgi:hypothetical protein